MESRKSGRKKKFDYEVFYTFMRRGGTIKGAMAKFNISDKWAEALRTKGRKLGKIPLPPARDPSPRALVDREAVYNAIVAGERYNSIGARLGVNCSYISMIYKAERERRASSGQIVLSPAMRHLAQFDSIIAGVVERQKKGGE
jgi:hypothetical protein